MSFLEIKNLKDKDKTIKEFLENRNKIKTDFTNKKIFDEEFKQESTKIFNPITKEVLLLGQKIDSFNNDDVIKEIKTLKTPKLLPLSPMISKQLSLPSTSEESKKINISSIIASYLSNTIDRSYAGYSLRYHPDKNLYSFGNSYIKFMNDKISIKGKEYFATVGLMELLTKSNPNEAKIIQHDYNNYKEMLVNTNALFQKFDSKSRLITFNQSGKYKIIKDKLFPHLFNKESNLQDVTGSSLLLLPSNPNELLKQLELSIASYKSGNNGEYNRINSILDLLMKNKIITPVDYNKIFKNIFN